MSGGLMMTETYGHWPYDQFLVQGPWNAVKIKAKTMNAKSYDMIGPCSAFCKLI